MFATEISKQLG